MCISWVLVKICVCPSFPFGIESGTWDVIVLIPDHCLSICFTKMFSLCTVADLSYLGCYGYGNSE